MTTDTSAKPDQAQTLGDLFTQRALTNAAQALHLRAQYIATRQPQAEIQAKARRAYAFLHNARECVDPGLELGPTALGDAFERHAKRHGHALALMLYAMTWHPKHFGLTPPANPMPRLPQATTGEPA